MTDLQKKFPTLQSGFTFFELIIVATIIGVLAVAALHNFSSYLNRSKVTEAFFLSATARSNITDFYRQTGTFPINNKAAGLPEPEHLNGKYISSLHVDHGVIVLQFKDNIGDQLSNRRLSIHPRIVATSPTTPLTFHCGQSDTLLAIGVVNVGKQQTTLDESVTRSICR